MNHVKVPIHVTGFTFSVVAATLNTSIVPPQCIPAYSVGTSYPGFRTVDTRSHLDCQPQEKDYRGGEVSDYALPRTGDKQVRCGLSLPYSATM